MRFRSFVYGAALFAGALFICSLDRAGAQVDARQACTPDAMRLCSAYIPDVARVTACMNANRSQLSEPCRLAMGGGRAAKGRAAPRHHKAHCGKHSKHC
jgi:hypothetical protein